MLMKNANKNEAYTVIAKEEELEGEKYISYGIASNEDGLIVFDISPDRTVVESYAAIMNRHHLSPIHLQDVIEDLICGQF